MSDRDELDELMERCRGGVDVIDAGVTMLAPDGCEGECHEGEK